MGGALDINGELALLAIVLILCEWTYVVIWTRRVGRGIVGSVTRLLSLRRGRAGVSPSPLDKLEEAAEGAEGDVNDLIGGIASQLGVEPDQLASLAQRYLPALAGGGKSPGGMAGLPLAAGGGQDAAVGMLLQAFLNGDLNKEDAIAMGVPLFMRMMRGDSKDGTGPFQASGASRGGGGSAGDAYWG